MPLYLISHATPLSSSQKDTLASEITKVHTSLFTTPSLFVNVRFTPADQHVGYVGGKKIQTNSISAHVRHGPARGKEMYDSLVRKVSEVWGSVVKEDKDIRIFVLGDIVAGFEHGFTLPEAGGDKAWMKEHMGEFEQKAKEGNEEMKELVAEIKERGLLD